MFAELNSNLISVTQLCHYRYVGYSGCRRCFDFVHAGKGAIHFPDMESGINFLASHVLGATLQVLLMRKPCVYVYDFIMFDNKVKETIRSGNVAQIENSDIIAKINMLIEENKLTHSDAQPVLAHLVGGASSRHVSNVEDEF